MPVDLTIQAGIHGTAGVSADAEAIQDTLVQFGYAWNLNDAHTLSVGVAPKTVYRAYFEKSFIDLGFRQFLSTFFALKTQRRG